MLSDLHVLCSYIKSKPLAFPSFVPHTYSFDNFSKFNWLIHTRSCYIRVTHHIWLNYKRIINFLIVCLVQKTRESSFAFVPKIFRISVTPNHFIRKLLRDAATWSAISVKSSYLFQKPLLSSINLLNGYCSLLYQYLLLAFWIAAFGTLCLQKARISFCLLLQLFSVFFCNTNGVPMTSKILHATIPYLFSFSCFICYAFVLTTLTSSFRVPFGIKMLLCRLDKREYLLIVRNFNYFVPSITKASGLWWTYWKLLSDGSDGSLADDEVSMSFTSSRWLVSRWCTTFHCLNECYHGDWVVNTLHQPQTRLSSTQMISLPCMPNAALNSSMPPLSQLSALEWRRKVIL